MKYNKKVIIIVNVTIGILINERIPLGFIICTFFLTAPALSKCKVICVY